MEKLLSPEQGQQLIPPSTQGQQLTAMDLVIRPEEGATTPGQPATDPSNC